MTDPFSQAGFRFRLDWGLDGLRRVGADAAVVVIVDVLRFTTAVAVAIDHGATVLPYPWDDDGAAAFAATHGAELAGLRETGGWSLSPTDLTTIPDGTRLVLPSPNGSALAFTARDLGPTVLAGCLRNATAVGRAARALAGSHGAVAVIPAGERSGSDVPALRVAVEDLLGAGAVLAGAGPDIEACSPDARAAIETFAAASFDLAGWLESTGSGKELAGWGWGDDVAMAAELDVSDAVPVLRNHAFVLLESVA